MNEKEIRAKLFEDLKWWNWQVKENPGCVGIQLVRAKAMVKYLSNLLNEIK